MGQNLADVLAYVTFQSPVYIIILLTVAAVPAGIR